jgi:osmoprotectant transport system substrate-binding protein
MIRCLFIRLKAASFPKRPVFAFLLLALSADWTGAAASDGKIVVASKIDTEGALLGNMILALLEARDLAVESKIQLGPTNIVRAAILAGQVDFYPEYTGNAALFFHMENDPAWKNWAQGYALVERLCREKSRLVWLTRRRRTTPG